MRISKSRNFCVSWFAILALSLVTLGCSRQSESTSNNGTTAVPKTIFGDGIWAVGKDIAPGTYSTNKGGNGCYWARTRDLSGSLDSVIVNGVGIGHITVTIAPTDAGFETQRCGTWRRESSASTPVASTPIDKTTKPSARATPDGSTQEDDQLTCKNLYNQPKSGSPNTSLVYASQELQRLNEERVVVGKDIVPLTKENIDLILSVGCGQTNDLRSAILIGYQTAAAAERSIDGL